MKARIKKMIYGLYDAYIYRLTDKRLSRQWMDNCRRNGIDPSAKAEGEDEYVAFWQKAFGDKKPDVYSYRLFSHYMGQVTHIIPEVLGATLLERYLNPVRYRDFYGDKNAYQMYFADDHAMPRTLMARISGGGILTYSEAECKFVQIVKDADIRRLSAADVAGMLEGYDKVCVKPSVDTCSGVGVTLMRREAGRFVSSDGDVMDGKWLLAFGSDFVVQEVLTQHPYLARFNPSSVNTLRICVYRSVVDGKCRATGALIRIGAGGSFLDNAHAGGRFVGIDIASGRLQQTTLDQYGIRLDTWNGVDFSKSGFLIPHWEKIRRFTERMAERNIHSRLLAFDICLDSEENPRVVEINTSAFSWWLFLYTGQDVFGGETPQVIEYCLERRRTERRHVRVL